MKIRLFLVSLFLVFAQALFPQAQSYTDPVQAYNRLVVEKSNGTYIRMGRYKVIGTPYLYGGKQDGIVYEKGKAGNHVSFSYNLYLG